MKEISSSKIIRKKLADGNASPIRTYIDLTVGQVGLLKFLSHEFLTSCLGPMPGGIGFYLRKKCYPALFKKVGNGLIIGRNVIIRHPDKIVLGNNVTIDDNCLIDARGAGPEGLVLEDHVIINRNSMIQAKAGPIHLGKRTSIGSNSVIVSLDGVDFGEAVLTAGGCQISAGAYHFDDPVVAVMDQGAYAKGPITIGEKSWLGTGVIVLDGISIGAGSVIGAGAVVTKDVPEGCVAVGVPARVVKCRFESSNTSAKKGAI